MMGEMNAVPEIKLKYFVPPGLKVSPAAAPDHLLATWGWV